MDGWLGVLIMLVLGVPNGNSLDVLEVDYYRKEAEFWLAEARAK